MNTVTTIPGFGAVSSKFATAPADDDLGAGITGGYGVMKYKGKVWTVSYKGEETKLMRADGDGARNSIDVVIVKPSKIISKIFYARGFIDGSKEPPDCFSTNGTTPDPSAQNKQATACKLCPKDAWGSRISESGKKGKACADSKRIAIMPANPNKEDVAELRNEMYGGPMLLRVPAASLSDLSTYADRLKASNLQYKAIVTRIAFDPNEAYPKFVFTPVRALTDAEADVVIEALANPKLDKIVAEDRSDFGAEVSVTPPVTPVVTPPLQGVGATLPSNVVPFATPAPMSASDFDKQLDDLLK